MEKRKRKRKRDDSKRVNLKVYADTYERGNTIREQLSVSHDKFIHLLPDEYERNNSSNTPTNPQVTPIKSKKSRRNLISSTPQTYKCPSSLGDFSSCPGSLFTQMQLCSPDGQNTAQEDYLLPSQVQPFRNSELFSSQGMSTSEIFPYREREEVAEKSINDSLPYDDLSTFKITEKCRHSAVIRPCARAKMTPHMCQARAICTTVIRTVNVRIMMILFSDQLLSTLRYFTKK